MLEKELLKISKLQTEEIEKGNFDYYYCCGDYKFYNSYLAHWYSQTTGLFPRFIANNPIRRIKEELKTGIDLNYNYDYEYLKKIRKQNKKLRLFLSGGTDSCTVLYKAYKSNIIFDEVTAVCFGDVNNEENLEILNNAIPFAEKYKDCYKKFTLLSITEDDLEKYYSDPLIFFKTQDYENTPPFFRQFWNQTKNLDDSQNIFATDKPRLMYYQGKWYAFCFFDQLSSHAGKLTNNNVLRFWLEPDNIKSYIKGCLNYRSFILKNNMLTDKKLQFFRVNNDNFKDYKAIDRVSIIDQDSIYKKIEKNNVWNKKDQLSLNTVIKNHNLSLLSKYLTAVNNLLSVYPNFNKQNNTLFNLQFMWAINIDTLEVFSQEELIPNGFEI
jgi:hypothetical protein